MIVFNTDMEIKNTLSMALVRTKNREENKFENLKKKFEQSLFLVKMCFK